MWVGNTLAHEFFIGYQRHAFHTQTVVRKIEAGFAGDLISIVISSYQPWCIEVFNDTKGLFSRGGSK